MPQDTGNHGGKDIVVLTGAKGHVDMKAVSRQIFKRLRGKIRAEPVSVGHRFDDALKSQRVIRRRQRIGKAEIDLILTGTFLMMGAFRPDPHLLERQADFAADVLAAVLRRDIHIPGFVAGDARGLSGFVQIEKIKFLLRAKGKGKPHLLRLFNGLLQKTARIRGKGRSVRMGDRSKHLHDTPVLRTPRKRHKRIRFGMQKKIAVHFVPEAGNRGSVKGNAVGKGARQLVRHDRNILLFSENVAEGKTDKFHVLLLDILQDFIL